MKNDCKFYYAMFELNGSLFIKTKPMSFNSYTDFYTNMCKEIGEMRKAVGGELPQLVFGTFAEDGTLIKQGYMHH